MSVSVKPMSTKVSKNADTFTAYLLRGGETGLCCCTEIMDDPAFLQQLDQLYEQQKTDFYHEFPPDRLAQWKARDISSERKIEAEKVAADPTYKPKNLDRVAEKRETILRKDKIFQTKPYYIRRTKKDGQTVNRDQAQEVNHLIHKVSATQLAIQTSGRTGHQFLEILPNTATPEQITHIIASIREAIPAGYPALITVHKDVKKNNLHLQGWISSKEWDAAAGTWKKFHNDSPWDAKNKAWKNEDAKVKTNRSFLETPAGLNKFCSSVSQAVAETGLKFKHADDKSLPATSINKHAYTRVLLRTHSKDDFISGKVKEGVKSERVRDECDQIGARAKAIQDKEKKNADIILALERGKKLEAVVEDGMAESAEFRGVTEIIPGPVAAADQEDTETVATAGCVTEESLAAAINELELKTKKESNNVIIRSATF
jgi:hypothetical protein